MSPRGERQGRSRRSAAATAGRRNRRRSSSLAAGSVAPAAPSTKRRGAGTTRAHRGSDPERQERRQRVGASAVAHGLSFAELAQRSPGSPQALRYVLAQELRRGRVVLQADGSYVLNPQAFAQETLEALQTLPRGLM
jgi:hypothetical protein